MIQLSPPLWLSTPKGEGLAHFLIAEWEHDLYWVVFLQSGEIWTFANPDVRACANLTVGRGKTTIVKEFYNHPPKREP